MIPEVETMLWARCTQGLHLINIWNTPKCIYHVAHLYIYIYIYVYDIYIYTSYFIYHIYMIYIIYRYIYIHNDWMIMIDMDTFSFFTWVSVWLLNHLPQAASFVPAACGMSALTTYFMEPWRTCHMSRSTRVHMWGFLQWGYPLVNIQTTMEKHHF